MLTTVLLGLAVVAAIGAAAAVLVYTDVRLTRWREQRRRTREWRDALRHLHSGHIDNLPPTGGPPDPTDPRPHLP